MRTREELEQNVSKVMAAGLAASMLMLAMSIVLTLDSWPCVQCPDIGYKLAIAGVLVLVATPIVRVLFCLRHFALIRDWKYIALTMWVLLAMILGVVFGAA